MRDPVIAADGNSYERREIERWFEGGARASPITNAPLAHGRLVPNHALRRTIEEVVSARHGLA